MTALLLMASLLFPASAPGGLAGARRLFNEGTVAYDAGHFEVALRDYEAAYRAAPLAGLLFNIAQCQRQLGHWKEAEDGYRLYLEALPDAKNRAQTEAYLAEVKARLPKVKPAPPPAVVRAPAPVAPLPATDAPIAARSPALALSPPVPRAQPELVTEATAGVPPGVRWVGIGGAAALVAGAACLAIGLGLAGADLGKPSGHVNPPSTDLAANDLGYAGEGLLATGGALLLGRAGWALWGSR
ncbi:MAG: hypothetical protein ACYCWW_05755 [Deltaproteobacteria bacterium]